MVKRKQEIFEFVIYMQSKRVLIIHGWESNSKEHWFLEEKERLEKLGHIVTVPDMPDSFHPKQDAWVDVITNFAPDDNSILIGHSLGGVAALRYLEGNTEILKCILIATPIRKLIRKGYDFGSIESFLESDFNWERIKQNCKKFVVMNQTNDKSVPLQHGKDLAINVGGKLEIVEGENHFDTIDFDLLEKHIL